MFRVQSVCGLPIIVEYAERFIALNCDEFAIVLLRQFPLDRENTCIPSLAASSY